MKIWIGIVFGIAVAAQIAVPASVLTRYECTLRRGTAWKFKTAPVDPYDAFRGRYVALRFQENRAPIAAESKLEVNHKAYAFLGTDRDGFARLVEIADKASPGKPYLRVTVTSMIGSEAMVELPFDRYYMEEHLAPAAEDAYRRSNRGNTGTNTYAVVRIRNGTAVIENLYIGEKPIVEYLHR